MKYTIIASVFLVPLITTESIHLGLMGFNTQFAPPYQLFRLGAGMTIALEDFESNKNVSGNLTFTYTVKDDGCDERRALGEMVSLVKDYSIDAVIGPACSSSGRGIGKLGSYWNIPIIAYSGSSNDLSDKTIFDTYSRTRGIGTIGGYVTSVIAKSMSWNKVCVHWREQAYLRHLMEGLKNSADERNISVLEPILHLPNSWGNWVNYRTAVRQMIKQTKDFCRGKGNVSFR